MRERGRMLNASCIQDGRGTNAAHNEVLTEDELAKRLEIGPRTLRLWRKRRGLPHCKLTAKCVRYVWPDVCAWLERHRVATVS